MADQMFNGWDVVRRLGIKGIQTGFPYHGRRSFLEIPHDRKPWGDRGNHSMTWESAAAGREMAYVRLDRGYGVWIPAEHADRARELVDRNGRKLKVTVGGVPCEGHTGSGGDTGTCGVPAVGTLRRSQHGESDYDWPLCPRHLSIEEGVRRRETERREAWDEERRLRQHQKEADRAAREMLDEDADLLEDLGFVDLHTDGAGHVRITVEQLIGLIRRIP